MMAGSATQHATPTVGSNLRVMAPRCSGSDTPWVVYPQIARMGRLDIT